MSDVDGDAIAKFLVVMEQGQLGDAVRESLRRLTSTLPRFDVDLLAHLEPAVAPASLIAIACRSAVAAPKVATSLRLPSDIDSAAKLAVEMGWARSLTELATDGLRAHLLTLAESALDDDALTAVQDALEDHYLEHPDSRPTFAEIVESAAEMEGHPAAGRADLIEAGIEDLGEGDYVEDVLTWVRGALAATHAVIA